MIVKHFLPQIVLLTVLTLQLTSVFCWTSYSKETSSDVDLVKSDLTTIKNEKEEEIDITTSTGPVQVEPVDQSLTTEADSSINSGLNSVESSTTNSPYSLRPEKQPTSFSKPASPISSPSPSSPLSTTTSTSTSAAANSSSSSLSTSQLNSSTPPSTTPVSRPTKNDEISESALRREETHKRKVNGNPSVDDIISGIMQLIGGNVKLSRPPITPRPGPPPQGRPILIPYPPQPPYHPHQQQGPPQLNNNNRINNRGPPKFAIVGGAPNHPGGGHYGDPHNLPPNILIGPGQGVGLPIPIPTSFNQPSHQQHSPSNQVPAIQQHPRPPDIAPSRPNYPPRETSQVSDEMESKPNEITSNYNTRKHVLIDDNHNSIVSADSSSVNHQQLKPSTTTMTTKSELNESETVNHQQSTLTTIKLKSSTATTITSTITTTKTLLQTNGVNSKINNDNNNQVSVENDFTNNQVNRSTSLESSMRPTPNQESSIQDKSTTTTTSTPELKFNSNSSLGSVPSGPVTAWLPFFVQPSVTASKPSWTGEPPPIITKPEEPSIFDITVKHKIGPNSKVSITSTNLRPTTTRPVESIPTISSSSDDSSINITSTSVYSKSSESSIETQPTTINTTRVLFPSKPASEPEPEVVYGRPANKDLAASRQTRPTQSPAVSMGRPDLYNRISVTKELPKPLIPTPVSKASTSTAMLGRPIVIPVDVDEVRPHIGGGRGSPGRGGGAVPDVITEPGQGSVFIDGKPTYFKIRPNPKPAGPTLQVGSGVTINIADNPSAAAGKGPGNPSGQQSGGGRPSSAVARRPPFRPRPNTPLVRIDTCIVGDDSTCGANLNEHCKTEIGISSCQCKPGFGRITARGMCTPVASLGVFLRLDKLGEAKVTFNRKLLDSDTEEFQYLEYEALQALNSLFTTSRLAKVFKGAKVNKFYSMGGKTVANATIELDRTNVTRSATIKRIVQQELVRVIAANNNRLGDSQLSVDASLNAVPRVDDINECANNDLNDCSKNAVCQNEFGSYRCICKPGYEDRFSGDPVKSGRQCASCSPQYCSNRGECFIVNGERECRCRGNFIGSRCDIDGEVLGVALGGSVAALIIIIITFLCLYMWNQRWKKEQQKMEAMSSGSGQTFSYVNKTQAAANYRCGLDDRARWATMTQTLPVNPNYNYYVNPEQLMATSQQHVYATPGRAQTPEALINDENCPVDSRHYPRPIRSKSRASLAPGAYSTMGYGGGSIYNETEFSTRETIYTPSHVIIPPRTKYSSYN